MALIVEDGTGLAAADAFVSVADCATYCTANGLTDWTGAASSVPDDEAAIRRATGWLSTAFSYKGVRSRGRGQALAFPRAGATDDEDVEIASDELPAEIVEACCIAAAYERANPGGLTPAVTLTNQVRRERIGPMETEYAAAPSGADASRPILTKVMDRIAGLLSGSANSLVGRAVRG